MDWKVIVMVCAIALAGILVWRMQKLKRDVCDFADGLEHSLDEILREENRRSLRMRRILSWER